ncbi:MAG: glutaredoxin family protein [Xanthomonadales bacterium]|nr:glutaredoxin family protein [Gammaproteobacteria bacterium]MBT8054563.1 glutaredoxin family protein [Gammaproteobacteria bacterium]NND56859.1 glutaredoxin family protein [Xanthomonadales bacterium]NNK52726.1 glutaredoxin family protein [Xanthomonadales bacterium]
MTAIEPFILFTRQDCHLCDVAARMLDQAEIDWQAVDIDSDPELVRQYGIHVPVVRHPASRRELFFPFDEGQLLLFTGVKP